MENKCALCNEIAIEIKNRLKKDEIEVTPSLLELMNYIQKRNHNIHEELEDECRRRANKARITSETTGSMSIDKDFNPDTINIRAFSEE